MGCPFIRLPEGWASSSDDVSLFKAKAAHNILFQLKKSAGLQKNDKIIALLLYKKSSDLYSRSVDSFFQETLPYVVDG